IARGEQRSLPGFEETEYMLRAPYGRIDLEDLLSELRLVRLSNIAMLRNLDAESWSRTGVANDSPVSVRALAFIMAGHVRHHMGVFSQRYQIAGAKWPLISPRQQLTQVPMVVVACASATFGKPLTRNT